MSTVYNQRNDHKINNPCYDEQILSMKCIEKEGHDHDKCKLFFENYNTCKRFWNAVKKDRKRKNLEPLLPPPEERAKIKEEFLKSVFQGTE